MAPAQPAVLGGITVLQERALDVSNKGWSIRHRLMLLALAVALPFVLLAVGIALLVTFVAVLCVLMIPLLPFAFVALFVWAIVRSSRPALTHY